MGYGEVDTKAHKQNNIRQVLNLIREHDTVSVAELAPKSKLSKTTVKKMIDLLVSLKLVSSAGKGLSTDEGGKKPELFRFNQDYGYVISLHITPEVIMAAASDLGAELSHFHRSEVGPQRDLEPILDRLVGEIRRLRALKADTGEKLIGVVVALPGLADSSRGISIYSPHYHSWGRNVPFLDLLRERLGELRAVPLFVDCVNRYQAFAERVKGVAAGVRNFMIIDAINVGLGAGIFLHGELMRGHQSLSGEIGHMTVNPIDGPLCNCGNRGCFEAMVSAKRLRELACDARKRGVDSLLFREGSADDFELERVCELAGRGDSLCGTLIDEVARWFAVGLGNIILVNDPELVVIQGQYVKAGEGFLKRVREGIRSIGLPDVEKTVRIEFSVMGEERGVIGGAAFVVSDFFAKRLSFKEKE
jgi:predicted NBD/HSP70 family sugar kinase